MYDGYAVGADDLPERLADGLDERCLRLFLPVVECHPDEVGEDLGVGLGLEVMTLLRELRAERQVVFYHSIMDEDEAPALIEMRMGILVGDAAVRRPASMTDPQMAMRGTCRDDLCQIRDAPDGLPDFDASAVEGGDACGVVAAVFKPAQSVQENRNCICPADVTNNAAHRNFES